LIDLFIYLCLTSNITVCQLSSGVNKLYAIQCYLIYLHINVMFVIVSVVKRGGYAYISNQRVPQYLSFLFIVLWGVSFGQWSLFRDLHCL